MPTVALHTLGCKVNQFETEAIWQMFKDKNYKRVRFDECADVYVINTCTVTNNADKKSRQIIRRAIKKNPEAIVVVIGCYAQISTSDVLDIEGVDIIIGNEGKDKIIELVEEYKKKRNPVNAVTDIMKVKEFEELNVESFYDRTRASIKIQEGCNNFCTYCIIPWARGLARSRKPESVLKQARKIVDSNYNEIVLTGIHTGGYGEDLEDYSFANLLQDLEQVEGLKRIRISSIECSQLNEELLSVLSKSNKIVKHLHIPIQSATDHILRRMKRKYTTLEYKEKIDEIKKLFPDIAITTDIIVGFPGETEELFLQGYNYVKDIGYAGLHVFPFSKRNGTPAAKMENQVSEEVKHERVQKLIELSHKLLDDYSKEFIGKIVEVIPERIYEHNNFSDLLIGHSDNYLQVIFKGNKELIGEICKVRIDEIGEDICKGTYVSGN